MPALRDEKPTNRLFHGAVDNKRLDRDEIQHMFLGAFAKFRKVTVKFVMSVCLFVRMEQLGFHCRDFD